MAPLAGQVAVAPAGTPAMGGVLRPPAHAAYPVTQSTHPSVAPYGQAPGTIAGSARFPAPLMGQPGQQQGSYSTAVPVRPMYQQPAVPLYPQGVPYSVQPQLVYAQQVGLQATAATGVPFVVGAYTPPAQHVPVIAHQLRQPASPQPGPSSPSQQQPTVRPRSTEFPGPQALKVNMIARSLPCRSKLLLLFAVVVGYGRLMKLDCVWGGLAAVGGLAERRVRLGANSITNARSNRSSPCLSYMNEECKNIPQYQQLSSHAAICNL